MPAVVNIAAYQFVPLSDLPALRERLLNKCKAWELRGTILISAEGINLVVAGGSHEIDALLKELRAMPGLENFSPKVSVSDEQPFNRMLVRIKKEIIAFGVPGIEPGRRTIPKVAPRELKRWLDERRPITLLDARNDYEVKVGTFKNAVSLGIDHFRSFPTAVSRLPAELKQQPIVMFCTGGIRCEKAGPYMEREGFEHVFQLEGGILKYFEECGGEHYYGECFVFDRRVGVNSSLAPTDSTQCFNCQTPLSAADQQDIRYVQGRSCPFCFLTDAEQIERTIAERELAIVRATTPLPGSEPYDNYRPLNISAKYEGQSLLNTLYGIFPHVAPEYWQGRFAQQLFLDSNHKPVTAEQQMRSGERYLHRMPATSEPDVNVAIRVLYEDDAIVVLNKPAPLPPHPSGRFNRNTLKSILNQVYYPQKPRPVHRLDANTTGVVVYARTRYFAGQLHSQFASVNLEKHYLARIQGHPPESQFVCEAPISNSTTDLGGRTIDEQVSAARTEFRVLRRLSDSTSIVEARPITGQTNQIRVHLWHLGWPICGEQTYLTNQQFGETQTHGICDPPLCLHALRTRFNHPLTGKQVAFECSAPSWAEI